MTSMLISITTKAFRLCVGLVLALLVPTTLVAQSEPASHTGRLYTIYSTLGAKGERFEEKDGLYVNGPKSGRSQWIAQPFFVTHDAEVTEIEVPIVYISGTNGVTISLNEDANGLPGKALHIWNLKNLPAYPAIVECFNSKQGNE